MIVEKCTMEQVFLRFPHLGEQIFGQLNYNDIECCKKINKPWEEFILTSYRIHKRYLEIIYKDDERSMLMWKNFFKNSRKVSIHK